MTLAYDSTQQCQACTALIGRTGPERILRTLRRFILRDAHRYYFLSVNTPFLVLPVAFSVQSSGGVHFLSTSGRETDTSEPVFSFLDFGMTEFP